MGIFTEDRKDAGSAPERVGQVGTFSFDGVAVEAFLSEDRQWHIRSAGCEVAGDHLGTATRTLFHPDTSPSTRDLIREILAWVNGGGGIVGSQRDAHWLTAPRWSNEDKS